MIITLSLRLLIHFSISCNLLIPFGTFFHFSYHSPSALTGLFLYFLFVEVFTMLINSSLKSRDCLYKHYFELFIRHISYLCFV